MPSRNFYAVPLLLALFTGLSGCEIINPDEDTPTYLKINKITLDPVRRDAAGNPVGSIGSASSKISDVWLYANGKEIGTFELPATIPILEKGDVRLDINAGVYIDGLKGNRVKYPFYEVKQVTVDMESGKATEINPVVSLRSTVEFPLDVDDDFASLFGGGSAMRLAGNTPYQLQLNKDTLTDFEFSNGSVGVVYGIPGVKERIFLESIFSGTLPDKNSPVYLEFDYKSTMNFEVGVAVALPNQPIGETRIKEIVAGKSRKWNRMYVELTNEVNKPEFKSGSFRVIMEGIPSGNPNDYIAIDNVRLLHF